MRKAIKFTYSFAAVIVAVISIFFSLFVGGGVEMVYAATSTTTAFEQSDIMDDLNTATIDGKPFNILNYPYDTTGVVKHPEILTVVEYCYSIRPSQRENYGVYVYFYNPQALNIKTDSAVNKITLGVAYSTDKDGYIKVDDYEKFDLQFCSKSSGIYRDLFYKFKVVDHKSAVDGLTIEQRVNSNARRYDISEVELLTYGDQNATAYGVGGSYTFTGYAKGYGADSTAESTLACKCENFVTLSIDVYGAVYRPKGTNGTNNYTQDMLHSVYFSVPNSVINKYGEMTAVHATWLNAKTAPIFVTGNEAVYNALSQYVGIQVPEHKAFRETCAYGFVSDIAVFNAFAGNMTGAITNRLNYMFLAPNKIADNNEADHYILKGSDIIEYMRFYTDTFDNSFELVAGKYCSELFEKWDSEFTDITIKEDETFSLNSVKLTQSFWEKFFNKQGTQFVSSETFNNIEAIHAVSKLDFSDSIEETCKNLYIDTTYYKDFKIYYDEATKNDETVYLFRYYQSEYFCDEAVNYQWVGTNIQPNLYRRLDTNAYVAQEIVNLDFDIIDLTLTKGNVSTVFACVNSPVDLVGDVTPPVNTTSDRRSLSLFQIIIVIMVLICFVAILIKFLRSTGKQKNR